MTLSTAAEHALARRADGMTDELRDEVRPGIQAEEFVFGLEGTEENPAVISSPNAKAAELADRVEREVRKTARAWGDSAVGDHVADQLGAEAGQRVIDMLEASACVEVEA